MNDITRLAYALHVAHSNGKIDEQVILRCMHLVREGGLDNIRVMEGGKSMEVSKKCPKCGISANKPLMDKYWFCPSCCQPFDDNGKFVVMDRNGNYISEEELNEEPKRAVIVNNKPHSGKMFDYIPDIQTFYEMITRYGDQKSIAKALGVSAMTTTDHKKRLGVM